MRIRTTGNLAVRLRAALNLGTRLPSQPLIKRGIVMRAGLVAVLCLVMMYGAEVRPAQAGNCPDDRDRLTDEQEADLGTDHCKADSDFDQLIDGFEANPYLITVGDEAREVETDPLDPDYDKDGLTDGAEVVGFPITINGEDVTVSTDPTRSDSDGDGLFDTQEINDTKTHPGKAYGDGDGIPDPVELRAYFIQINGQPRSVKTDPNEADTDGDGLSDGDERDIFLTDPTKRDTDNDGIDDGTEARGLVMMVGGVRRNVDTSPTNPDTDGDGLSDGDELIVTGPIPPIPTPTMTACPTEMRSTALPW